MANWGWWIWNTSGAADRILHVDEGCSGRCFQGPCVNRQLLEKPCEWSWMLGAFCWGVNNEVGQFTLALLFLLVQLSFCLGWCGGYGRRRKGQAVNLPLLPADDDDKVWGSGYPNPPLGMLILLVSVLVSYVWNSYWGNCLLGHVCLTAVPFQPFLCGFCCSY